MDNNKILKVQALATDAHKGQLTKTGKEPYINHLIRVMTTCSRVTSDEKVLCSALLHDIYEKTDMSEKQLSRQLSDIFKADDITGILQIVRELTNPYSPKGFPGLSERELQRLEAERLSAISSEGQTIKYADILDHLQELTKSAESDLLHRRIAYYAALLENMHEGNLTLYKEVTGMLRTLSSEAAAQGS